MDNDVQRTGLSGIGDQGAEFAELIERLEKATGPDREINSLIADWQIGKPRHSIGGDARYTGSIDAALTLVPEGYRWLVGNAWKDKHGICPAMASVLLAGDYGGRPTAAATPAIALCIAALRARAALSKAETK